MSNKLIDIIDITKSYDENVILDIKTPDQKISAGIYRSTQVIFRLCYGFKSALSER